MSLGNCEAGSVGRGGMQRASKEDTIILYLKAVTELT